MLKIMIADDDEIIRVRLVKKIDWSSMGFEVVAEAAEIDGANKFQRIRHISISALLPMACVLTIMNVGDILNSGLGLFYYVTRDAKQLYEWTDVIDTYVFRSLTTGANFSVTSAVTLFQNVVGLILIVVTNKIARPVDKEYALY